MYILVDYESAISAAIPSINEMGIVINQTAKEHAPEVERAGRTLKERVRAVCNKIPYKLTNEMIIGLTYYCVYNGKYVPEGKQYLRSFPQRTVHRNQDGL